MEAIEVIKKIRDACDEIIKANDNEDENEMQNALGKFMLVMVELDCLK